ncbi:hypothetical protein EDB81DRAFT_768581 [Dactylonectria macrodidyma]|uniref:Uncharacterized protein n=1 Tax=Dactylonectria macrodidyma TaxID=307937 RepID=A0A9P9D2G3_9HYPO|nr:hypothetical protein EDB81DRAFT_768581 [Dactylonectria macrodidyma]
MSPLWHEPCGLHSTKLALWRDATRNGAMDAVASSIVVAPEGLDPLESGTRKSDRPRKLTAKGIENLAGNVGTVIETMLRESREETVKQITKTHEEAVKEITSAHVPTMTTRSTWVKMLLKLLLWMSRSEVEEGNASLRST